MEQIDASVWGERTEFTSPALIKLDYFTPPEHLDPYVTTFFTIRCEERFITDVQPASVGIFIVFMRGRAQMHVCDGTVHESHRATMITPLAAATRVQIDGPWHAFGAAISPLGWAALTGGESAAEWGNRMVDAGTLLGPQIAALGETISTRYNNGQIGAQDMIDMTSQAFAGIVRHVPQRHAEVVKLVADWLGSSLSPDVEDLFARSPYSPRQLQRLVDRYYGLTPKQLARKYRALRAATLLGDPATPAEQVDHVADQFYDQSHMIREIRLFAGRTPARLTQTDQPMMSALLDLRNFREVRPKVAAMPAGLGAPDKG